MSRATRLFKGILSSKWSVLIPLAFFSIQYFVVNHGAERLIDPYVRWDERINLNVASDILEYSATQGPYNVSGLPYVTGIGGFWVHPPLYYVIISPIASSLLACRLLSLSFTFASVILIYLLAERRVSNSGVLAATVFAIIPSLEIRGQAAPLMIRGDVVTLDALWLMFMALTLTCFAYEKYNLALIFCALGINVKYPYALVLLPLLLMNRRRFVYSVVVACLALLPFGIWSYAQGGDFLMLNTWAKSSGIFISNYPTPGWPFIILLLIVAIGVLHKKLSLTRELPFLLVVAGNLAQFYATPARTYYYMFPSYIVLSVIAGTYLLLLAKSVTDRLGSERLSDFAQEA